LDQGPGSWSQQCVAMPRQAVSLEDTEASESEGEDSPNRDFRKTIIAVALLLLAGAAALAFGVWLGREVFPVETVTPTDIRNGGIYALKSPVVQWRETSQESSERLRSMEPRVFEKDADDFTGPTINFLNARPGDSTHEFEGFGGAFTESAALVYKQLSPEQQQEILEKYFGADGLGYTLGRTHINSCDFSTENYAFANVPGDIALTSFDTGVARDAEALIPLIKAAQQMIESHGKELKLLATPWSPPAWMKTNGRMDHSDRPCLKADMHLPWATYFNKWISAYKAHGVPIWAITVQNEPENNATWEGCLLTPQESNNFVEIFLGPELQTGHPEVKLFIFDHNKDTVYKWAKAAYNNPMVKPYVDGVAYHWYMGDGFDQLKQIRKEFPQAALLASEATWERWRWKKGTTLAEGDWSFGEGYAHDIIGDLNAGSIGWIDWNLLLDQDGGPNHVDNVCDAVAMADLKNTELYWHPQYYYIGHFSKFIPRGSKLIETQVTGSTSYTGKSTYGCGKEEENCRGYGVCTGVDGLQATAFLRPDDTVVVVALNCGDDPIDFMMKYGPHALRAVMPKHGIQTYIFEPAVNATKVVI